jgi:hypothetical protein
MKLSEAIMLGSTQLRFEPKYWMCEDGGCLLGLGGYALGVRYEADYNKRILDEHVDEIGQITAIWPWINDKFEIPKFLKDLPPYDDTHPFGYVTQNCQSPYFAKGIISIMAVQIKLGNMTLEQAVDWIRENEPQEAEIQPEVKTETEVDIHVTQ